MTSNTLASARSIFEQNIQKNKAVGCDKNILGQTSCSSRKVSRRLFASQTLSDSSKGNNNNNLDTSVSSTNSNHNRSGRRRRSSLSDDANPSAQNTEHYSQQPKGQLTVEQRPRTEVRPHNVQPTTNNNSNQSSIHNRGDRLRPNLRVQDALSKSDREERRQRSVSSLADHLGKLDIPSLHGRRRGGGAADIVAMDKDDASQVSIESHRNRITLPVFRQSSFARATTNMSIAEPSSTNKDHHDSASSMDDSNQSYGVEQLCHAPHSNPKLASDSSLSSSSLSSRRNNDSSLTSSGSSLHDSRERLKVKRTSSTRSTRKGKESATRESRHGLDSSTRRNLSSPNNNGPNNNGNSGDTSVQTKLTQHLAAQRTPLTSWIQPSAVVTDDDESCSSTHHNMPFNSVPFTKTTIKRHNSNLRRNNSLIAHNSSSNSLLTKIQGNDNNNNTSASSMDSSSGTLGSSSNSSSSPFRVLPTRRRSSMKRRLHPATKLPTLKPAPPQPDPEEVALREEIEAIQNQLQAGKAKLLQIQEGEQCDLKRVQETKDRKLKRIDATNGKERSRNAAASATISKEQEQRLKEKYKQAKSITRQLKQENARIDDQNRTTKVEVLTTASSNGILEESIAEVLENVKEVKTFNKQSLQEHDLLVQLASTYQKSVLDLEDAIEKKDSPRRRVKSSRQLFEDRIDMLVDLMQKKCKDYDLVEELTIMAAFEDEEGWEDGEDGEDSDEEEERYLSRIPYRNETGGSGGVSPSATDLLMPSSSHSLHIFL